MPRLSIVIPCLGSAAEFEDTLVSVLQNRPPRCEVLVVHAQPYADPYSLQDEVRFIRVSGQPNLAQLANTGLESARGEIVHLLGCRMEVQEGWAETALDHLEDTEVAAVSPLIVAAQDKRVVAAGVNYGLSGSRNVAGHGLELTSRGLRKLRVSGPTLDAGFYRREVLLAIGGWHEPLGADAADVDLAQTLTALRLQTVVATDCVVYERLPAKRSGGFSHGRAMERLYWRQSARSNRALAICLHALLVALDFCQRLPKGDALTTLLGRVVGFMHAGTTSQYRHALETARAALDGESADTLSLAAVREQQEQSLTKPKQQRRAA